jgi:hypothetical protein
MNLVGIFSEWEQLAPVVLFGRSSFPLAKGLLVVSPTLETGFNRPTFVRPTN